jgi:hypothetical protein
VLKIERFGKQIKNSWEVVKCGAGEGWRRSVGPTTCEMKKCYIESRMKGITHIQ